MEDEVSEEFLQLEENSKKTPVMQHDYQGDMDEVWERIRALEKQLLDLQKEINLLKYASGRGC